MSPRRTREELISEIDRLRPYRAACGAMSSKRTLLSEPDGPIATMSFFGAECSHGGLVEVDGQVHFAIDWTRTHRTSADPYVRSLVGKVDRLVSAAVSKHLAPRSPSAPLRDGLGGRVISEADVVARGNARAAAYRAEAAHLRERAEQCGDHQVAAVLRTFANELEDTAKRWEMST